MEVLSARGRGRKVIAQPQQQAVHYKTLTTDQMDAHHSRMLKAKQDAGKAIQVSLIILDVSFQRHILK
jgi:hypothetical protein